MTRIRHSAIVLCLAVAAGWVGCARGNGAAPDATRAAPSASVPGVAGAAENGGGGDPVKAPIGADPTSVSASAAPPEDPLAGGFAVWESNRDGRWRIWTSELDGTGLRPLSREEPASAPRRQHCCPHISPDGRWVVYLSRDIAADAYPEEEVAGELRLVPSAASAAAAERTLADSARTYGWGNRAAVWRDGDELIYVDGDGRTRLLEIASGRSRPLTDERRRELGWLIDATLRHATTAAPSFSLYDPGSRRVAERRPLGGCEPYFSHDGRWGYWIGKGGGPVERIDLGSREISTLIARDDPRLPAGRRYVYFPMLSGDGRAFAWGASGGEHDHFRADYDIFVAASDPHTLDLAGPVRRLTDSPATDRYPDVWVPPLPLGHHAGEAPLAVEFPLPGGGGGELDWSYGDGAGERATAGRHTYTVPGRYGVTARRGDDRYRGQVVVDPPRPPRAIEAVLEGEGRRIAVRFDRPVITADLRLALESGLPVAAWRVDSEGRGLVVDLEEPAVGRERLYLAGASARGGAAMPMPPTWIAVEPPPWPIDRRYLVFLWEAADRPNLVFDPGLGLERAFPLEPERRARFNREGAMVVDGGAFASPPEAADEVAAVARSRGELTLELTVRARTVPLAEPATVVWLGPAEGPADFRIDQQASELVLHLRGGAGGAGGIGARTDTVRVPLGALTAGDEPHLAVTIASGREGVTGGPGRVAVYRDGRQAHVAEVPAAVLGAWRGGRLVFGDRPGGGADWAGVVSGVALWARVLPAAEVAANAERLRRSREARANGAPPVRVRATLAAKSDVPSLREISPYRQALAVYEYRVDAVLAGTDPGARLRVARWVILDGETLPSARAPLGEQRVLELEPFSANPQLESHYLSNTLPEGGGLPLYYDLGVTNPEIR